MSLLALILIIVLVALLMYIIPMSEFLKRVLYALVVIAVVVWLLGVFGQPVGFNLR